MRHFIRISLTLLFSVFIIQMANGQGLLKNVKNKTRKKIEEKIEERAVQRADKEIDKQLDKAEEAIFNDEENETKTGDEEYSSNSEQRLTDMMKKMGVGGEPIPIQDSYSFQTLIKMHIESENKKGEKTSEGEFITHLGPESGILGYEFVSGDMAESDLGFIIVDAKNKATIILSEDKGKKTGLVYGLGSLWGDVQEENMEELDFSETPDAYLSNPNVTKTGKTKTIAGYKCQEYKYTDEYSDSNIWITRDLKMNSKDFFGMLFKTSLYTHGMGWGYMMEASTVNKESGEKSTMTITDVNENSNRKITMNDYEVTNLGSFAEPTEN